MNHTYRLIWNHAAAAWVAVAEIARSGGKRSSGAVLAAGLVLAPALAWGGGALPGGGSVVHGQAAISQSGSHMQVQQASKNAVLNWNDFSIGKGASVHFANGSGATLNRVTGSLPSSIDGRLSATGVQSKGGRIVLTADGGTVRQDGELSVHNADGAGGQILDGGFAEVSGKRTLDFRPDAPIDLSAPHGQTGTELLDPDSGSGNIAVNADLAWSSANTLALKAGNIIEIDADITASNGALEMYAGRAATAPAESSLGDVTGSATLTAGHTITTTSLDLINKLAMLQK